MCCDKETSELVLLIKKFLDNSHEDAFSIGVHCLQSFVRMNWLCHTTSSNINLEILESRYKDPITILSNDKYIPAYQLLRHPRLLCLALEIILNDDYSTTLDHHLWKIRVLFIKQIILNESNAKIYNKILEEIKALDIIMSENVQNNSNFIMINLEICHIFLWYRDIQMSSTYIQRALEKSGFSLTLEGRLGKRTRYQSNLKSLLSVVVNINNPSDKFDVNIALPKDIPLNDDTLLKEAQFEDELASVNLSNIEESLVIGIIGQNLLNSPISDILCKEEILAYISWLINNSKVWCVKFKALYLRSKLEIDSSRKIDRSLSQMEHLLDLIKSDCKQECVVRLKDFFNVFTDPLWKVQKSVADILFTLGCTKSALEFYTQLELWEKIVECYCRLDRRDKAEAIIRKELIKEKTPYLLCILGDVTENKDHYLEAWELSKYKSSKAQKSLGDWHFLRKEYADCIQYYLKSLEINSINAEAWSRLAYASLDTENYELAAKSYRRVVIFDWDNFEAWNNLSKAYIKLGNKKRALKTLQDAIRCNFEEWRIWENYLLVALDCSVLNDAIRAWHQLINLKHRYHDDELLEILIAKAELNDDKDLIKKVRELCGRINATGCLSSKFFRIYAQLMMYCGENDKVFDLLQKSISSSMRKVGWEKSAEQIKQTLDNIIKIGSILIDLKGNEWHKTSGSFRLSMNSIVRIVENNSCYWTNEEKEIRNKLDEAQKLLKEVENLRSNN